MFLSRVNNDAGLGDVMNQTNRIYKLAAKLGLAYAHEPMRSRFHGESFDELLGLDRYPVHVSELALPKRLVGIRELAAGLELQADVVYAVAYDYTFTSELDKLTESMPDFPYQEYYSRKVPPLNGALVHLRLGDSHVYPLEGGGFFDARYKAMLDTRPLRPHWTLEGLIGCIRRIGSQMPVTIVTDGVSSAHKLLHHLADGGFAEAAFLRGQIDRYFAEVETTLRSLNVGFASSTLAEVVGWMASADTIIYSDGSLAQTVNKFLRPRKAKLIALWSFGGALGQ